MRVLWTTNELPMQHASLVFIAPLQRELVARGIDVDLMRLGNLRSPFQLRRARRDVALKASGYDLVHAQYGSACAWVSCADTSRPFLMSIRGNDWNLHSTSFDWLYLHTRLARRFTQKALPFASCVLCVSHRLCRELSQCVGDNRTCYLPSPVDFEKFKPLPRSEARNGLNLPSDKTAVWVLFNAVKLSDPVKRFPLAQAAVREAARMLGRPIELITINHVDHNLVPHITAACDLILSTSETEGWPNCVKEALACDVPFVATDTSDLAMIACVEPSCRIAHADANAIARAMCEVTEQCSRTTPSNLRRHIAQLSLGATATRLAELYARIVNGAC